MGKYVHYAVGALLDEQNHYPEEPQLALALDEELANKKREREIEKQRLSFLAVAHALAARDHLIDEPAN